MAAFHEEKLSNLFFDSRVRISFAASGFVQILIQYVIGELNTKDMELVMAQAT